jgi:16S rRNA (cytosine967-C5)-methyltransferase
MKLHRHLVGAIADALREIISEGRYADKVIERLFRQNPKWGSRDRRFVAEAIYDIVRYYRLYAALAESRNNYWFMIACWLVLKNIQVPTWNEFQHVNEGEIRKNHERLKPDPLISESYPDWLWERCARELGEQSWRLEAVELNKPAEVFLRVNSLRSEPGKLIRELTAEGYPVEKVEGIPNALRLLKRSNVFKSKLFQDGLFEVQDAGSQLIGEFVNPKPGEVVVDGCCGAGGKSLQLAALMKNKGRIVCFDVEERKLEELRKRARRAGAFNIEAKLADAGATAVLSTKADKVLLDVPCSGTGVLKRNPDAKWKLSPESIETTSNLQAQILNNYSEMTKYGGELIYSTCSILPSENEEQVRKFLSTHPEFEMQAQRTICPHEGFDGFYMAKLVRKKLQLT